MTQKHLILKGTIILTLTGFLTRIMGFFYRMFLSHTFGEEGVGLYQLAFPIYAFAFSLTSAGIQIALSRCVAAHLARENVKGSRSFLYTSLVFALGSSLFVTLLLQKYSSFLAGSILHDNRCELLLLLFSYALPFAALHSCIVGYYFGQKETKIPAISQFSEQTARIISVLLICHCFSLSSGASGIFIAVLGVIFGEIVSSCYCFYQMRGKSFFAPIPNMKFSLFFSQLRELLTLSVPLTANRLLLNLLQSIESISIPLRLQMSGMDSAAALSSYGVLTGMALPCVLFPSAITNSVSTMLLPTVAEIHAANQKKALSHIIQKTILACVSLGCFCCAGLLLFGNWIGTFLFHSPLAGDYIVTLAWICPFLYTNNTFLSILNGLGKTGLSLLFNTLSLCIRIYGVLFCIPVYGISGYLIGLLISQIFIFLVCGSYLFQYTRKMIDK